MNVYGDNNTLQTNQIYTVVMKVKGDTYDWNFTSKYDPLYSTIKLVRNVAGGLIENVNNEDLNLAIWQVSIMVDETFPSDKDKTQYAYVIKQYTTYKTAYELAYNETANHAAHSGSETKNLGDLQTTKEVRTPSNIAALVDNLKRQELFWEHKLYGAKAKTTSAIKAKNFTIFPALRAQTSTTATQQGSPLVIRRSF